MPASAVDLALTNYLSNTVKYRDPKEVEPWAEIRAWIQTNPEIGAPEVTVAVADNGLGVPREAQERLFQRFFRAHAKGETEVEGSGLGL